MFGNPKSANIRKIEIKTDGKKITYFIDFENVTLFAKVKKEMYYAVFDCSPNALKTVLQIIDCNSLEKCFKNCDDSDVITTFIRDVQPSIF